MKHRILLSALCALLFAQPMAFARGKTDQPAPSPVRISALAGPSSIPLAWLFDVPPILEGTPCIFEVAAGPDLLLPRLVKGDVDVGVLPVNVAARAYIAGNGVVVLAAVIGEGMLSLVTADPSVSSLADLRGKVVNVAGQGATPEYVFRYLLRTAGIHADVRRPDAVQLDFSLPTAELAPALLAGKIGYAVLPEPFATVVTANTAFRRAVDLQSLFAAAQSTPGAQYPMTALVVRADFAAERPDTVRLFLAALEDAVARTVARNDETGSLAAKHGLGIPAALAAASIPRSAFVYRSAADARPGVERFLGIVKENGGADENLPDSGFYFR
ncbi:MAG: ABC transporter substrate-binding protein [Spirochaetaceae bacterium]|jgi:NitT/TauT family transport system substrate-binding protein|nr:ABC transporter substrate-binding protein [Spirochaetaceae bacterium]